MSVLAKLYGEIEHLVSLREEGRARSFIRSYLKDAGESEESVLSALEWYRRLGLYHEGYRLATRFLDASKKSSGTAFKDKFSLWVARYLHLLGSSALAARILNGLTLCDARDFQYAGGIYLADWNAELALKCYQRSIELEKDSHSREARICRFGLADALAASGKLEDAIDIVKREQDKSLEGIALGVALSCEGEYLARAGSFKKAKPVLEKAEEFIPKQGRTADRALWLKWYGWTLVHLGRREPGLKHLSAASTLLRSLGIREEAFFDILRLRDELGVEKKAMLQRVRHFPGLAEGFLKLLPERDPLLISPAKPKWEIDLSSDEWNEKGQWNFELLPEIRLTAWLVIAGDWGLNRMRALSLIWPDEPYSLLQLEKRLEQVLIRAKRKFRVDISSREGALYLDPDDLKAFSVYSGGSSVPRLLRDSPDPKVEQVVKFYGVKKSKAYQMLKGWAG